MENNSKNAFVKGAFILGISGLIVKIIGAFFRIPIGNIIGPEGMGYYTTAYPIYNFFVVLATAGFPTAIARIVAEQRAISDHRNIDSTFRSGLVLMSSIGLFGALLMWFGAPIIVNLIDNPNAIYSLRALAPSVFIVSVLAVFRGYFQGYQLMEPFAYSQIVEQLGRVAVGYSLALILLSTSVPLAAAGATIGAAAGAFCGLILILIYFFIFKYKNKGFEVWRSEVKIDKFDSVASTFLKGRKYSMPQIILKMLQIAIPITIGASVLPMMGMVDVAIVLNRLADIGMGDVSNELFGVLNGYAATIVNLPQAITSAIQISVVPAAAMLFAKNDTPELQKLIRNGIKITVIISLPAAVGLMILSEPIMLLLYPRQADFAALAGQILSELSLMVMFLGVFQVTTGIMQGMNLHNIPVKNLIITVIFKAISTYVLVGIPMLNIHGASISTVLSFALAALLNTISISKRTKTKLNIGDFTIKPIFAVAVMSVCVLLTYYGLKLVISGKIATVISIFIGIGVYLVTLLKTGSLSDSDYDMIPGGSKLKKLATKLGAKN